MKTVFISLLFLSFPLFAQSLDVQALKALMTERKDVLEVINQGMSKKITTRYKIPTEMGPCEMTETAVQTILKIEDTKMIVHSKERFSPGTSVACEGVESEEVSVIFYQETPSVESDLSDLDATSSEIASILKMGDIITMKFNASAKELVTVKYDLSKPSFKNTLLIQDSKTSSVIEDIPDIEVSNIDLSKVLFCESADSENCVEGDWSDILF